MLNTQELANFISSKLNEISSQKNYDYVFDLGAEMLPNDNNSHIKGILHSITNNPLVIKDFVSAKMQYQIEFSISTSRANKNLIQISEIISSFVSTYEDDEVELSNGKCSFEFTYPHPAREFSTQHSTGDTIPLQFELIVNFTDGGLLGSSKIWLLDGVVIPYKTEAILLEKDGQTNRISTEYYNKSIMLAQTKYYKFTMPYDANSTVCTTLQADLLAGNFSKTYILSYYDGVNYTSEQPYSTTVSIFRSGGANSDGGSISMLDITFADVSTTELDPKYTIELFSTPFDETNVRFFDGVEEQAQWFNNLPHPKAVQIKAPTLNTIMQTTQVYDYDGSLYDQITLANMNYARINEKSTSTNTNYQLNFTDTTTYEGTITNASDLTQTDFSVVNSTPVVIEGITYILSVNNGVYSLTDGGGQPITITNNAFVLNYKYYFEEDINFYKIVNENGQVVVQVSKQNSVNINNITLSDHDSTNTYSNLTLIGSQALDGTMSYVISNSNVSAVLEQRQLTVGTTLWIDNESKFYVEQIDTTTTDSEPVTTTTYKVILSARPGFDGANVFDVTTLGAVFATINGVDYTLENPNLITASNNTSYELIVPSAKYYKFKLENTQFYMDTTRDNSASGVDYGYLTFYNDYFNEINSYNTEILQNFVLFGTTYTLRIAGDIIQILYGGTAVYADISETKQFDLGIRYEIATTETIVSSSGKILKDGEYIAPIKASSTTYQWEFQIEGITYYINKVNNVYNLYYANGNELASGVENNGTFAIPGGSYNYYYYHIQSAELGANNQILLTLELDTVQTYLVNNRVTFSECLVQKAHLNRFIDNGDGTVSFNGGVESPLFEREQFQNVSKRIVSRKVLKYNYEENSSVERWMQDNILGWVYAFFPNQKLSMKAIRNNNLDNPLNFNTLKHYIYGGNNLNNRFDGQFIVLACPIYNTSKRIILRSHMPRISPTTGIDWEDYEGIGEVCLEPSILYDFITYTTGTGYEALCYSLKFSTKPPYDITQLNLSTYFEIDSYGNLSSLANDHQAGEDAPYYVKSSSFTGYCPNGVTDNRKTISGRSMYKGFLHVGYSAQTFDLEDYELLNPLTFPKKHSNHRDKTIYTMLSGDLTSTFPQTFTLPRPSVNIEEIAVVLNYKNTDSTTHDRTISFPNKKGTWSYSGIFKVNILDSSIVATLTDKPYPTFDYWNYIVIKERVFGIVGANKNPIYNPKLLNSDYRALRLTNERGSDFDYDIQKLNTEIVQTEITEPLTADVQRTYFRAKNTDGVYQVESSENLTGLVETAEISIPFANTATKTMLANQPNYFNQRTLSNAQPAVSGAFGGAVGGVLSGLVAGPVGAVVGAAASLIPNLINNAFSDDNMKKQPHNIQNANGSIIFNLGYTLPGPTIEQYALLPAEETIINDQMFMNGFTYNRIGQLREHLHTRKYFNFIQAEIEGISGVNISNAAKMNLKERLSTGIRLWHTDNMQYELENYELWLEEE